MIRKTKIIFLVSVLFLIFAIGAYVFISLKVEKAGVVLEERVKIIADQYAKEQKFAELANLVDETKAEREMLDQYILSEADTISFLTEIEHIGAEQGVELVTNSLDVVKNEGEPSTLRVSFSVVGTRTQVFRMLTILESLPYQSQVERVSYNISDDAKMNVVLLLTII